MSEKPTCIVTNFTQKEHIRQDFFSGSHGVEESLENVMRQFNTGWHAFVGTSDKDRAVAEETGWGHLPVEDAAGATEWVLTGDDDVPADSFEVEGCDNWPQSKHSGAFAYDSVSLSKTLTSNDTFCSSTSHQLSNVQAFQPGVTVGLSQVGITGARKLVKIARDGERPLILMAESEVFVDLPGDRKGTDTGRDV